MTTFLAVAVIVLGLFLILTAIGLKHETALRRRRRRQKDAS